MSHSRVEPIMNQNARESGLALIVGSLTVIVTLILHPTERGLFDPAQVESIARTMIAVHSLALISLPLLFLGACGLSRAVGSNNWLGVAGLVIYGFAGVAMMNAVILDGLVTPGLARAIANAAADKAVGWKIALNHNVLLDQAFMSVFLVASSVAIALWSLAIVRRSALAWGLGIFGFSLGVATVTGQLTGWLAQYPHIFGIVLIGQAIWFTTAGVQLYRSKTV